MDPSGEVTPAADLICQPCVSSDAYFETTKFGEPRNFAIQISDDGKVGSIVYEVPDISLVEGKSVESLDRFAMTMRKEGDAWRIVHGMTAVATRGESSSEIVARKRMKTPKK